MRVRDQKPRSRRAGRPPPRRPTTVRDAARDLDPETLAVLAEAARKDPAVFLQYVMRDEETGRPITLAPFHVEWQDLFTQHKRVVLWSATELGKTSALSIGRVLWEIGTNPNIRIVIISDTADRAKKIVKTIKNYIERSPEYRTVFPHVLPDKDKTTGLWKDSAFHIKRTTVSKDPTVQAIGFEGALLGARADLIVIDDYLTPETTYSQHMRDKGHTWLKSVVEGRKTARSRFWFIGNAWHRDDAMHRYAKERNTYSKKYAVRDSDGHSVWPSVWPEARIDEEIQNRGPIESRRSMFCDPASDADRRFKEAYITRALQVGDGIQMSFSLSFVPKGWVVVTGVDLAVSKKDAADWTALVTVAIDPKDQHQLVDITAAKLSGPEIVEKIIEIQRRYHSMVWVESNAAQRYIKQFVDAKRSLPVRSFNTGKNKHDPAFGIESLAVEFSNGKWALPNDGGTLDGTIPDEVKKLIEEMLSYDPMSHTGDRLMATWIAREGARKRHSTVTTGKRRSKV
jgi:hypothetical protein